MTRGKLSRTKKKLIDEQEQLDHNKVIRNKEMSFKKIVEASGYKFKHEIQRDTKERDSVQKSRPCSRAASASA